MWAFMIMHSFYVCSPWYPSMPTIETCLGWDLRNLLGFGCCNVLKFYDFIFSLLFMQEYRLVRSKVVSHTMWILNCYIWIFLVPNMLLIFSASTDLFCAYLDSVPVHKKWHTTRLPMSTAGTAEQHLCIHMELHQSNVQFATMLLVLV